MRSTTFRPAGAGDVVVVTGASSGIGEDATKFLAGLGYTVAATVRRPEDGDRLVAASPHPERIHPVLLDVTHADQLPDAVTQVEGLLAPGRGLTALFSNAGIAALSGELSCEACPVETQQRVMEVNFFGAVHVIQAFLPSLRRERGTLVVNTALMARTVLPFNAGYAASKCALEGWVDSLRREVAPHGVRVAMIEAAAISTSLEGKQDAAEIPDDTPYPEQRPFLRRFLAEQARMGDDPRCSPRRVSEKVAAAIQSPRPPIRTIVGGGSRPIWLLGALPDRVQDKVFATMLGRLATRDQPAPVAAR